MFIKWGRIIITIIDIVILTFIILRRRRSLYADAQWLRSAGKLEGGGRYWGVSVPARDTEGAAGWAGVRSLEGFCRNGAVSEWMGVALRETQRGYQF